jgi:hypothetical protein
VQQDGPPRHGFTKFSTDGSLEPQGIARGIDIPTGSRQPNGGRHGTLSGHGRARAARALSEAFHRDIEEKTRLIRKRFSSGHGFGLHSCALAAHSDGPGQGAVFTLEIPVGAAFLERPLGAAMVA